MNLFSAQGEILYCTGCNNASNVWISNKYHACCPDNNYKPCSHDDTYLKIIDVLATCETTVLFCNTCKTELSQPKTDCI